MEGVQEDENKQSKPIKRILFTSRLNTDNIEDAEMALKLIKTISIKRNIELKIKSVLYCNIETFNIVYLMEGPIINIDLLFQKIAQDSRHTKVSRLIEQEISVNDLWISDVKEGFKLGNMDDFSHIKGLVNNINPKFEISDVETIDLELIDKLPIAGDLDMSLVRVIYRSKLIDQTEHSAFLLMQNIVEHAQKKNESLLIGGILLITPDFQVVQCLEGPSNAVKKLYKKIESDTRHIAVEFLLLEKISKRKYKSWGMCWANEEAKKELKAALDRCGRTDVLC